MCREMNREPAWVAAIRLALLEGVVDVGSVMAEANLAAGRERTVRDVLATMADRDLLVPVDEGYRAGPALAASAPSPGAVENAASQGVHRWAATDD